MSLRSCFALVLAPIAALGACAQPTPSEATSPASLGAPLEVEAGLPPSERISDTSPAFIDAGDADAPVSKWAPLDPAIGGAADARRAGAVDAGLPVVVSPDDLGLKVALPIGKRDLAKTDGTYASFDVFGRTVKVVDARTSSAGRVAPADVTLDTGRTPLVGLLLQKTYVPRTDGGVALVELAVVGAAPDGGTSASAETFAVAPVDIDPEKPPRSEDGTTGIGTTAGDELAAPEQNCEATAVASAFALGPLSLQAPAVTFPSFETYGGCTKDECVMIRRSWLLAHYYSWLMYRWAEYFDAVPDVSKPWAWTRPGHGPGYSWVSAEAGLPGPATWSSPEAWFGGWAEHRWDAVRQALHKIWDLYRTGKTGGITFKHQCDPQGSSNVCQSIQPIAHHWVKGWLNFCLDFFQPNVGELLDFDDNPERQRVEVTLHESIHHLYTSWWQGATFHWEMIKDHHLHEHGDSCGAGPYESTHGLAKVGHLAEYANSEGESCGHREDAITNVDTYAQMITLFGEQIHSGKIVGWPMPADETPQPPENCDLGTLGCQCAPVGGDPNVVPDGDAAPGTFCVDDDGQQEIEVSCALTKFNADDVVGICRSCEDGPKPGGCACSEDDECGPGLTCFGEDTGNGGAVGRCYPAAAPPSWACLADCAQLMNDDLAWCDQEDPQGGHCYDSLCDKVDVAACAWQGKTCRYGECVVECVNDASCDALGYPAGFQCMSGACRAP